MPLPAQEPETLAQQPRGDIRSHQRPLQGQGPRAAHGIDQGPAGGGRLRPAGAQQDGGGEVLLERRLRPFLPVAAPVQALPGEVEAQGRLVAQQAQVEAQVRPSRIDGGAHAAALAKLVDDGVLDLQGGIARVGDRRAGDVGVDGQGARGIEMVAPVDLAHPLIEGLGGGRRKDRQAEEHPAGQPRPEADPVADLQCA